MHIEAMTVGKTKKKSKVVKKVRVLSPPPLSPDTPEWPHNSVGPAAEEVEDPFNIGASDDVGIGIWGTPLGQDSVSSDVGGGPPANPFNRTLQDLEESKKTQELKEERREEGAVLKAANSRGSLNVDSFRRLLMTGSAGDADTGRAGGAPAGRKDDDTVRDALERSSSEEHQKPRVDDSGDVSDSSVAVQIGQRKKAPPPPPPSSRHGKSIKSDVETVDHTKPSDARRNYVTSESLQAGTTEGDAAPPQPEDSTTMVKAAEADTGHHSSSTKKPAPAPPPRRGHARMESKATAQRICTPQDEEPGAPAGSSSEAIPIRASTSRHSTHAPAPPPPRRPLASGQRLSMVQTSPTSGVFNSTPQHQSQDSERSAVSTPSYEAPSTPFEPSAVHDPHTGTVKLSAPPPPPARNSSTRRPPSVSSMDVTSRHVSAEAARSRDSLPPPPPPPSRKRGSSKGSMDGPPHTDAVTRTASGQPQQQQPLSTPPGPGQGDSLLADLDALQREVDALRGKLG